MIKGKTNKLRESKSLEVFSFLLLFLLFFSFSYVSSSTDLESLEQVDYCVNSEDIYWFDFSEYYDFTPTNTYGSTDEYYYKILFTADDGTRTAQNYLFISTAYQYATIDDASLPQIATDYTWVGIDGNDWGGEISITLINQTGNLFQLDDITISDSCSNASETSWLPLLTNYTSFYWSYENTSLDDVYDEFSINDGDVSPGNADIVTGWEGNAIDLDGTGETIITGANLSLTDNFTFGTWFYADDLTYQNELFKSGSYWILVEEGSIYDSAGFVDNSLITENDWIYFVIVFEGRNISTYLNGNYIESNSFGLDPVPSALYSTIGSNLGSSPSFDGLLDETFLIDYALSSADISSLYNSGIGVDYNDFELILSSIYSSFNSTYNGTTYNVNLDDIDYCFNPNYIYWFDYNDWYSYSPTCEESTFDNYMFKFVYSAWNESFNTTQYIASSSCDQFISVSDTEYNSSYDIYFASDSSWVGFETFYGWEGDVWVSLTNSNLTNLYSIPAISIDSSCAAPDLCSYSNPVFCQNENDCLGVGGFWWNFVCYSEAFCTESTPELCDTEYREKFDSTSQSLGEVFPKEPSRSMSFWIMFLVIGGVLFSTWIGLLPFFRNISIMMIISFAEIIVLLFFFANIEYISNAIPITALIAGIIFGLTKIGGGN